MKLYIYHAGDDDNARLTLTASAWNARAGDTASVVLRRSGSDAPVPPELEVPSHDSFLTAKVLEGLSGSESINLASATSEAGESEVMMHPDELDYDPPRPRGSMWYAWTSSKTGFMTFRIEQPIGLEDPPRTSINAFRETGDGNHHPFTRLQPRAFNNSGKVSFQAAKNETYYFRVGDNGSSVPVTMTWDKLERPVNDGWQHATILEDQDGSIAGNNSGATLEYSEWPGGITATVWYRWTASSDGAWSFDTVRDGNPERQTAHHILVYTGEDVASLRTVSDFRNIVRASRFPAVVQAARGQTYHISIGSPLPESGISPGAFDLIWEAVDWEDLEDNSGVINDNHGDAISLSDGITGSQTIYRNFEAPPPILTVEPGEPLEAGIFTRWYSWMAPETRQFTWLIQDSGVIGTAHYRVTIFEGDSFDDLDLVGSTASAANTNDLTEFTVPMVQGQHYMIAVGFPPRDTKVVPGSNTSPQISPTRWSLGDAGRIAQRDTPDGVPPPTPTTASLDPSAPESVPAASGFDPSALASSATKPNVDTRCSPTPSTAIRT